MPESTTTEVTEVIDTAKSENEAETVETPPAKVEVCKLVASISLVRHVIIIQYQKHKKCSAIPTSSTDAPTATSQLPPGAATKSTEYELFLGRCFTWH